jgi:hypothetical protein
MRLRTRSLWQKSGRLNACPTKADNSLSHNGGARGFACESLVEIRLPQAVSLVAALTLACAANAATFSYHVIGDEPGAWPRILSSVGLTAKAAGPVGVFVVRGKSPLTAEQWTERVEKGAFLILESESDLASALGFKATGKHVVVRGIEDVHNPQLQIVWEKSVDLPAFDIPAGARVFTCERWERGPLAAGYRRGAGGVLWVAASPGLQGYERFPYLLQALADLGFDPPFRSRRLWAFFDSSYRSRVDIDYFAERWRKAGISALHVAAWHFFEPDKERDSYLDRLIEACHKRAILVYAWLELPHVSEKFWNDHPEWREKTALLQDAQLDWRKLINLANPEASRAVEAGIDSLLTRHDWDGANLAELYFESLEGYANPARLTPMNGDVRREFRDAHGFDPVELFDPQSPRNPARDAAPMRQFLEYRAALAKRIQSEWIQRLESIRHSRPWFDLVLTHVDDRFDTRMRDLIGADASAILPLLARHDLTFLIEDPATVWNLGPDRYPRIAEKYNPLTTARDKLAIDINIADRYQDVYPTKQQTGSELFQLVHLAAASFPRVALYFENSILPPDIAMVPAAASVVSSVEHTATGLAIDSQDGAGVPWKGPALVDGRPWPVRDSERVWIPPGRHVVEPGQSDSPVIIEDLNGDLRSAAVTAKGAEIAYRSSSRVLARLGRPAARLEVDGQSTKPEMLEGNVLVLPRGQHLVTIE